MAVNATAASTNTRRVRAGITPRAPAVASPISSRLERRE